VMPSRIIPMLTSFLIALSGCTVSSPLVQDRLKLISAGHTGCLPDANEIANVTLRADGSAMWNATCQGKTYLCSAVSSLGNAESISCALAVP